MSSPVTKAWTTAATRHGRDLLSDPETVSPWLGEIAERQDRLHSRRQHLEPGSDAALASIEEQRDDMWGLSGPIFAAALLPYFDPVDEQTGINRMIDSDTGIYRPDVLAHLREAPNLEGRWVRTRERWRSELEQQADRWFATDGVLPAGAAMTQLANKILADWAGLNPERALLFNNIRMYMTGGINTGTNEPMRLSYASPFVVARYGLNLGESDLADLVIKSPVTGALSTRMNPDAIAGATRYLCGCPTGCYAEGGPDPSSPHVEMRKFFITLDEFRKHHSRSTVLEAIIWFVPERLVLRLDPARRTRYQLDTRQPIRQAIDPWKQVPLSELGSAQSTRGCPAAYAALLATLVDKSTRAAACDELFGITMASARAVVPVLESLPALEVRSLG